MRRYLRLILLLALPALACGPLAATPTAIVPPPAATLAAADTPVPPTVEAPSPTAGIPADTPTPSAAGEPSPTAVLAPAAFDPARYQWAQVASGLSQPVGVRNAGDGSGRLFVIEQTGAIRIIADGSLLPQPFLDLSSQVSGAYEQGLLGLAFHPDFPNTPYFYVNYTDLHGDTQIVRYSPSGDPNVADPDSAIPILSVGQPYPNHNGGNLIFGPDGSLYIGMGDGGAAGDPQGNAQNLGVLLGKMLRLDVNGDSPYGIPPGNPFAAGGGRPEIWAYGLRNPWRFSFDRATGDLYIGDVGQNNYEEVDFQPAASAGGEDYGWDFMEGLHPYEGSAPGGLTPPIAEYGHDQGCSVTGGYVYRGSQLPEVVGTYFYADFCSGLIWTLARDASGAWQNSLAYQSGFSVSSFGEDEAGELYLTDLNGGVYQLVGQ